MSKFESGRMEWTPYGADAPELIIPCVQCVHCGQQFPMPQTTLRTHGKEMDHSDVAKRTRIGRGFCTNCNGYVCGPGCAACVPQEQLLENIEAGRAIDFRPVVSKPFASETTGNIWTPGA